MKGFLRICRKGISYILCGVLLLAAAGCGKEEGPESIGVPAPGSSEDGGREEPAPPDTSWKAKGFAYKESPGFYHDEMPVYHEVRVSTLEASETDFGYYEQKSIMDFLGDVRYTLSSCRLEEGQRFLLETNRSDVDKPRQRELFKAAGSVQGGGSSADSGGEAPAGYAACMDAVTESDTAVLFACPGDGWEGEAQEYLIVHFDGKGKELSRTDVTESYLAQGIDAGSLAQDLWHCDGEGNSYVLDGGQKTLDIFDAGGAFLMRQDCSGEEEAVIEPAFHAPDGSVIFPLSDPGQGNTKLMWMDLENKQWKELASLGAPYLRQFTMREDGQIYYTYGSGLIRWDTGTGVQEKILDYAAFDISNDLFEYVKHVSLPEQEEMILYVAKGDGMDAHALTSREQEGEGIRVVDLWGGSYLQSCAAGYSREHGTFIEYKESSGDTDAFWTRTMAEIAAGGGPDVICLAPWDEHIRILHEKGVLVDLEELVPGEVLDPIFPGVLEAGRVDGKLVGLGMYGTPVVLVVSEKLWQEDEWTTEDIEGIIEAAPGLEGIYIELGGGMSPEGTLDFMCLNHLEESPFLDYGEGESRFGDAAFQRILEHAKAYGGAPVPAGEISKAVKEGRCLTAVEYIHTVWNFTKAVEEYGGSCRFMGFPGQRGHSGYWFGIPLALVNRNSAYLDEIAGFLQYLVSFENQQKAEDTCSATTVNEDVVREHVVWDSYSESWIYKVGRARYPFTKPDGESYVEEYVEFLKKLEPGRAFGGTVADIVLEEAGEYFKGVRSAAQAAEIIDNRVQLYLDE